jgi:ubiquinol-cytochrome c reductase cytochrome b subunit
VSRPIERGARRVLTTIDAAATRLYGASWNPVHQSGALAVAMLVVLLVTGLYLVLFYRVGSPSASVAQLAADPWLGRWIRGVHRYATDIFIVAAVLHLLRMFSQSRSWGPRTTAWVSGLVLFGVGCVCAWTGFVMAWDSFGERLARDGCRVLDALPIFSEPLCRIFAGDGPVPSAFFFVNLFMHIGLPLAMGAVLWLHVSRVARPTLLPPRRVTWTVMAALTALAVVVPPLLGPAANAFRIEERTPVDLFAAWWLPVSERLTPAGVWGIGAVIALLFLLVPRFARQPREDRLAPSVVDPRLCTGCNQCPQDCPWEAITMVQREDDRPTLLAQVNPDRCVSCGICAGSCAPMGVGPPGRSGRDQLATVREELRALPADATATVVTICCEQVPESHVAAVRARGAQVRSVSCVGNLHSSVIELLLRGGVRGVMVYGCPSRDCVSREGPKWLLERLYHDREAELQARVDRRRVRVGTMAPGDRRAAITAFDEFSRELDALERPAGEAFAEPDTICVPVPLEDKSS